MKKGIYYILLFVVLVVVGFAFLLWMDKSRTVRVTPSNTEQSSETVGQIPADGGEQSSDNTTEQTEGSTQSPAPTATADISQVESEAEQGMSSEIKAEKMTDTTWELLGLSQERLEYELKVYANGQGYVDVDKAIYCGEITVNEITNLVKIGMYFPLESGNYYFDVEYNKESDYITIKPW